MAEQRQDLELLFLGSGNAFAADGRAFSSLLVDGRYLFDCGPTVLQQLHRAGVESKAVEAVFISHFHADHFLGLPFLFLDAWHEGREADLTIVGPPGIQERTEQLLDFAFPRLPTRMSFERRYIELRDGLEAEACGLAFTAAQVEHAPGLECFAFRCLAGERSFVYSGDTTLCDGLLRLVPGAEVVVLECSCAGDVVHLSAEGVAEVVRHVSRGTRTLLTHLDGHGHAIIDELVRDAGLILTNDLERYRF